MEKRPADKGRTSVRERHDSRASRQRGAQREGQLITYGDNNAH